MTHTFTDKSGIFTISVKEDFLKKCPNPENFTARELNQQFQMWNFLHSTTGPAVINRSWKEEIKDGPIPEIDENGHRFEWWENGLLTPPERIEEHKHNLKFKGKLKELCSE